MQENEDDAVILTARGEVWLLYYGAGSRTFSHADRPRPLSLHVE